MSIPEEHTLSQWTTSSLNRQGAKATQRFKEKPPRHQGSLYRYRFLGGLGILAVQMVCLTRGFAGVPQSLGFDPGFVLHAAQVGIKQSDPAPRHQDDAEYSHNHARIELAGQHAHQEG